MRTLPIAMLLMLSFTTGFVLGCTEDIFALAQKAVQEVVAAPFQQSADEKKVSYSNTLESERSVTIVFTLDEKNKIHVLHVSGGYNLVTQYIKNSLEGKEINSENAIPGINYVMTIKLPASV